MYDAFFLYFVSHYTMTYVITAEKPWLRRAFSSYDALSHHSLRNLHEACYVSTLHVVYIAVSLCTVLHAVLVEKARMKTSFMSQIPEPNPKAMIKAGLFCLFPFSYDSNILINH